MNTTAIFFSIKVWITFQFYFFVKNYKIENPVLKFYKLKFYFKKKFIK